MTFFFQIDDKVRPGAAVTLQELSFSEVTVLVLIKHSGQIWIAYLRMRDAITPNLKTKDSHHHSRSDLVFK